MAGCHAAMNLQADVEGLWQQDRTAAMPRILEVYRELAEQAASERWGFNKHLDREEFAAAAMLGLWQAAKRYNPTAGCAFTTFSQLRMWGSIRDREREADTAPSKLRAAEKRGEVEPLPAMFSMGAEDSGEAYRLANQLEDAALRQAEAVEELQVLLNDAEPWAAKTLRDALECGLDLVVLGERYGCGFAKAVERYEMAMRMVRGGTLRDSRAYATREEALAAC